MINTQCNNCEHNRICFIKLRLDEWLKTFNTICEISPYNDIDQHITIDIACDIIRKSKRAIEDEIKEKDYNKLYLVQLTEDEIGSIISSTACYVNAYEGIHDISHAFKLHERMIKIFT